MTESGQIFIGKGATPQYLNLGLANRHGLITGATGTGKTVTLQILAEGFSDAGVPVFLADVKGDLSGLCVPGEAKPRIMERAVEIGLGDYPMRAAPCVFWDLFAEKGHPIRTTVSEMGPLLLSRLLGLNETQEGVLSIVFQVADDDGLLLLDLKDLRALITHVGDNAASLTTRYGNVSRASIGAIQRRLLTLEQQGGEAFFGEPALDLRDFMRTDLDGRGFISVLAADKLMMSPRLYSTFLLWLMAELFEELPEVGDADKPRLVFFFDEAHLLFDRAPEGLIDKVEQVVRLIRSKGVGIYFVTQNPLDVPETVLSQLGNRVQHALRAFTPRDQKAVKTAADTFRQNPAFDAVEVITQLGVGEALVSTLEKKGVPSIVDRTLIRPPASRIGPASHGERAEAFAKSPVGGRYENPVDRDSAYEILVRRAEEAARNAEAERRRIEDEKERKKRASVSGGGRRSSSRSGTRSKTRRRTSRRATTTEALIRDVGRTFGREIVRGILGSIFKGR